MTQVVIFSGLPTQELTDGSTALKVDGLQHPPGWTYLCLGYLADIPQGTAPGTRIVSYFQITDEAGAPMDYRAWTGKITSENCSLRDVLKVEMVIKGSSIGGIDDVTGGLEEDHNDMLLDQFVRDLRPLNNVLRKFTDPDRSILVPADASTLNPGLPQNTGIFFKIVYVPSITTVSDQCLVFDLEGFEPPTA